MSKDGDRDDFVNAVARLHRRVGENAAYRRGLKMPFHFHAVAVRAVQADLPAHLYWCEKEPRIL